MVGVLTLNSRDKAVFSSVREGGLGFGIGRLSEARIGRPCRFNAVAVITAAKISFGILTMLPPCLRPR